MRSDADIERDCRYHLAVAAVFQDEAPFLKEWIEFHQMVGVDHFLLVDDRSTDEFEEVLQPYVASGVVEVFRSPCPESMSGRAWPDYQRAVLQTLLGRMRCVARWVALIDVDEFLVPMETDCVAAFLRDYEDFGGLYVRWEPFGTGFVEKLSRDDLVVDRMLLKWKYVRGYEMLGKSIVKPHRVAEVNIHRCELAAGFAYFDSNPDMERETSLIRVHHYWSRDEEFLFTKKLPRTLRIKGWEPGQDEYFRRLFNDTPDYTMRRFTPELRARVFGGTDHGR